MDLSTPALEVVAPDTLVVSNVGIGGAAYTFSLRFSLDGSIVGAAAEQGHRVRTAAELQRDDLLNATDADSLVSGFGAGDALPDEGAWSMTASGTVVQTDAGASHAKFAVADVAQSAALTLYGLTARVDGGERVGYGLHFLASGTPDSGNTWNFGHSYLVWLTREPGFYDTEETQVQLYESLDDNRLVWRKSRNLERALSSALTLEALYDPNDCPETMGDAPCHGSIAVLVDGAEQFKVAVSGAIAGAPPIPLRCAPWEGRSSLPTSTCARSDDTHGAEVGQFPTPGLRGQGGRLRGVRPAADQGQPDADHPARGVRAAGQGRAG